MKFKRLTLPASARLIVPANAHRKSYTLFNDDDNTTAYVSHTEVSLSSATQRFPLPPKSSMTFSIPEDVPQFELWGYVLSGSISLYVYEEFKKSGKGVRNI